MFDEQIDVAVICATEFEFKEVDLALTAVTKSTPRKERIGNRVYQLQEIVGDARDANLRLVLISPNEIGRVPAALAARDLLYNIFQPPTCVILCGIAAAAPDSQYQLGDVVIPRMIVDYAEQKHSPGDVSLRARRFPLEGWLFLAAVEFAESNWFETIPKEIIRFTRQTNPRIRIPAQCHHEIGMACGDFVLNDESTVRDILGRLSKEEKYAITCVELESTGVARGLELYNNTSEYIVVKAISDFAARKTDGAQPYARTTSAYFLRGLLIKLAGSGHFGMRKVTRPRFDAISVYLGPSDGIESLLREMPQEYAIPWRHQAIDGAIEILRCPKVGNPYGGITNQQIICNFDDAEWPDYLGGLTREQSEALAAGLVGREDLDEIKGWLRGKRGWPGRIRVLTAPPAPPILDRPYINLNFANSDFFTALQRPLRCAIQRTDEG